MTTTTFFHRHPAALAAGFVLAASMSACGGGGGTVEPPHFELTTVGGVAAVKDNVTGITWARQIGDSGLTEFYEPTVGELATMVGLSSTDRAAYFSFLPSDSEKLFASVHTPTSGGNYVWAVDLGTGPNPGEVKLEQISLTPDYAKWFKLSPSVAAEKYRPRTFTVNTTTGIVSSTSGLSWKLCTEGSTYTYITQTGSDNCSGTPVAKTYADAGSFSSSFARLNGWRLPTREELVELLQFDATINFGGVNKLPAEIRNIDTGHTGGLNYWTSTESSDGKHWQVDFSNGTEGGVSLSTNVADVAYVRLVRK